MDNEQLTEELLKASNYDAIANSTTAFVRTYIKKLVWDVVTYVDESISVNNIELVTSYSSALELSQEITGIPAAYSAIDGETSALTAFSEQYAHLGIAEYDTLAREAILDFLNLHNGLFVSLLSKLNMYELSLAVPKQSGSFSLTSKVNGKITIIPITFSFGTINFCFMNCR